jgi:hypothetical protein
VNGAISTYGYDYFVVCVNQTLCDVHSVPRALRMTEVDLEASLLESRLELVPLAYGETIAGIGIEYAGYACHAPREPLSDFNTAEARNHE